jgi:hypothetical protein
MTAVAGLIHGGRVHIGADSAGVAGRSLTVRADQKVFTIGRYVLGFTDSFRMGQLLRYCLIPPPPEGDLPRFMATVFVDTVRDCLKAGGSASRHNEQESGGHFLVGVHGRLFRIGSDYQVGEAADGFDAVGCGSELCLGALHATRRDGSPRRRLRIALEAAERFNAGVRGPFVYATSKAAR